MSRFHVWFQIRRFKADRGCVDCGEKDPDLLDFDHVNGEKVGNISQMLTRSFETLKRELEKCDVRCVRCHRMITSARKAILDAEITELEEFCPEV